ncbi:MAG: hypothetical protein QF464_06565 [Myxococcota bacterium]|nr:hypothetical protein [Myxococcota bacterium]
MSLNDAIGAFIEADTDDDVRFDALAREVFAHQCERIPLVRALADRAGCDPRSVAHWRDIPAVPSTAFKATTLFGGAPSDAVHTFASSGTSGASKSKSVFSATGLELMAQSVRVNAARWLFPDGRATRILVLAPSPDLAPEMIMAWGMNQLIDAFGLEGSRFLIGPDGLDPKAVVGELMGAAREGVPITLIGASFGFVHLLDGLAEAGVSIPSAPGSRTMDAGGYKGRSRELCRADLDEAIAERLGVPPERAVNLLGMTELASQFYDGVLVQDATPRRKQSAPWTRTRVVAPDSLEPVSDGERGLLVHVDLANLERPAFVRTDDVGMADGDGFEVFGRASGAESRGCSLSVEELLG